MDVAFEPLENLLFVGEEFKHSPNFFKKLFTLLEFFIEVSQVLNQKLYSPIISST